MSKARKPDPKIQELRASGTLNPSAGDVSDPLFQGSAFFDARDVVQVKYEMLRRAEVDRLPITQVSTAFGYSRPAFYDARQALEQEGLAGLIPRKRGPKGGHKLTDEILTFLEQTRADDPSSGPQELALLVAERFGVAIHPRSVERAMLKKKRS